MRFAARKAAGTRLRGLLAALACGSAGVAAQPVPAAAPVLSLDAALTEARTHNRPLQAERLGVDRASQQLAALRAQRKPLFDVKVVSGSLVAPLNFRFPVGVFGTFAPIGPVPPADTTITTNPRLSTVVVATALQPLTALRRIGFGEDALSRGRDVASEQVRAKEAEIDAGVRTLYYAVVQAEAGLRAREESLRLHREVVRLVDRYEAERVVLRVDALAARATLAQQEVEASALRRAAQSHREQLNVLLGRDLDDGFSVEPLRPLAVDDASLDAAEARALADRPEVRIGRLRAQQAGFDLQATETPGMPDVSVAFNYAGFYGFELLPHHGALAGVLASWEPWDWGRRRAEREEKRLAQEQAALAARETEAMIRADVRARFRDVQDAIERVRASEAAREAAHERLRVATDRFSREATLERDLLEAQTALAQVEVAGQQALSGYWIARAAFERARGDR